MNCNISKERYENFPDLILQVKGMKNIEESINQLMTPELLEGDNKYFCENCNEKNEAVKGIRFKKFPDTLILSLNRYEYDQNWERQKINDKLEFGLEMNVQKFLSDNTEDPEEY